MYFISNNTNCG